MSSPSERLRNTDLDTALKSTMIGLCRDLCLPHSGWKAQLANQLRIRRSTLPPAITTSSTAITPTTTAQTSNISPQPALSSICTLTHATAAPTSSANNTALQPSDTGSAPSNPPQPVIHTYAGGSWQPNVPSLALQVPPIGTTFPLPPASQAQLSGASLPITLPLIASQANTTNTSGATLPINLPLTATQANTSGATLPINLPLLASQANSSGATLPITLRCFSVYATTLCAYQPHRGPDMLAYLHVIASAHEEFHFAACMAYDVVFRKKAANFRLST